MAEKHSCEGTLCDKRYIRFEWVYRIALMFVLSIVINLCAAVAWKTTVDIRMKSLDKRVSKLEESIETVKSMDRKIDILLRANQSAKN